MITNDGRRSGDPSDPTEEPSSDPVPTGEDVVNRHKRKHETPRRDEQTLEENPVTGSDDATLNTQI